jgi:hypothetical protein
LCHIPSSGAQHWYCPGSHAIQIAASQRHRRTLGESDRTECLDHVFIFNERHSQGVLAEYVGYFNDWRPHRSLRQRAPVHREQARLIEVLKLE